MHPYRTHTCGELALANTGEHVRLSGWIHRKRDHGGLLFIDLRDHYGVTQCVITTDSPHFEPAQTLRLDSVVTVDGTVVERPPDTVNEKLPPYFDYLERQLGDGEFFVGGALGIADISVATQFVNFYHAGAHLDDARWPKLADFVARMHSRPSFAKCIEDERKILPPSEIEL